MLVKVTDICSTDPSDPSHCATPNDIKMDRAKVQILYLVEGDGKQDKALQGDKYNKGGYWHFSKCWTNVCAQILKPYVMPAITTDPHNCS